MGGRHPLLTASLWLIWGLEPELAATHWNRWGPISPQLRGGVESGAASPLARVQDPSGGINFWCPCGWGGGSWEPGLWGQAPEAMALSLLLEGYGRGCDMPLSPGRGEQRGQDLAGWYSAQRGLGSYCLPLCLQTSCCPPWARGRGGADGECQGGTRLGMCLVTDSV